MIRIFFGIRLTTFSSDPNLSAGKYNIKNHVTGFATKVSVFRIRIQGSSGSRSGFGIWIQIRNPDPDPGALKMVKNGN